VIVAVRSLRSGATRGGILAKLLVLLTILFCFAALLWMLFLPRLVALRLTQQSNFNVGIDALVANPFTGQVDIRGLTIENPAVFASREFVQLRRFRADAQVFTALRQRLVLDEVTIELPLIAIVTNTDGTTNLDLFRDRLRGEPAAAPRGGPAETREFLIKRLHVKIGEVRFINHASRQPRMRSMPLDFEYTFQNVSDWKQLLVPELLRRTALAGGAFEGLVPEDLGRTLGGWARSGGGVFREPSRRATETMKSLFQKLEDSAKP
jgi:hypothetical protein